jgi:hypothetical protein
MQVKIDATTKAQVAQAEPLRSIVRYANQRKNMTVEKKVGFIIHKSLFYTGGKIDTTLISAVLREAARHDGVAFEVYVGFANLCLANIQDHPNYIEATETFLLDGILRVDDIFSSYLKSDGSGLVRYVGPVESMPVEIVVKSKPYQDLVQKSNDWQIMCEDYDALYSGAEASSSRLRCLVFEKTKELVAVKEMYADDVKRYQTKIADFESSKVSKDAKNKTKLELAQENYRLEKRCRELEQQEARNRAAKEKERREKFEQDQKAIKHEEWMSKHKV